MEVAHRILWTCSRLNPSRTDQSPLSEREVKEDFMEEALS